MEQLKLVLGTDDGKRIFKGHLGDSARFHIYILKKNGEISLEGILENNTEEEKIHGGEQKMRDILSLIGEVDLMVSRKMSPNFKRIAASTPIQPVRVLAETIDEALDLLRKNYEMLNSLVERRKKGERPEDIPRLS